MFLFPTRLLGSKYNRQTSEVNKTPSFVQCNSFLQELVVGHWSISVEKTTSTFHVIKSVRPDGPLGRVAPDFFSLNKISLTKNVDKLC